jgi:hypothetical protein
MSTLYVELALFGKINFSARSYWWTVQCGGAYDAYRYVGIIDTTASLRNLNDFNKRWSARLTWEE